MLCNLSKPFVRSSLSPLGPARAETRSINCCARSLAVASRSPASPVTVLPFSVWLAILAIFPAISILARVDRHCRFTASTKARFAAFLASESPAGVQDASSRAAMNSPVVVRSLFASAFRFIRKRYRAGRWFVVSVVLRVATRCAAVFQLPSPPGEGWVESVLDIVSIPSRSAVRAAICVFHALGFRNGQRLLSR